MPEGFGGGLPSAHTILNEVRCSRAGPRIAFCRWRCDSPPSRIRRHRRIASRRCGRQRESTREKAPPPLVPRHDAVSVMRAMRRYIAHGVAEPSTTRTAMMASRYSVSQSCSLAGVTRGCGQRRRVARTRRRREQHVDKRRQMRRAQARSTSSVSAAPQTPVRRILALSTILLAISRSAAHAHRMHMPSRCAKTGTRASCCTRATRLFPPRGTITSMSPSRPRASPHRRDRSWNQAIASAGRPADSSPRRAAVNDGRPSGTVGAAAQDRGDCLT